MKEFNILIAGVGGQGVILMSELLGQAAVTDGLQVRGSEVLGMAVRGGPVMSAIRIGSEVYGPLIPAGKADLMVGMEPSEALRNSVSLSPEASIIVNTQVTIPFTVSIGQSSYPPLDDILRRLGDSAKRVVSFDADEIAVRAGSQLAANVVMLGAAFGTGTVPIHLDTIKAAISDHFPEKLVPLNLKAFDLGFDYCRAAV
jgi:indolepyruvate ferredoxin oxidoreductase, beta subunit